MTLQYLSANADSNKIANQVEKDGAPILNDVIRQSETEQLIAEIGPFIDNTPTGKDDFPRYDTQRTGALKSRSATCRSLYRNNLIFGAATRYLSLFTRKILLHLTQAIKINPGGEDQVLHRGRLAWGTYLSTAIEPQFNTIWALTDFSKENGAKKMCAW